MAEAFIQKGAKAYISWNGPVAAHHTDHATIHLLQHSIMEKQAVSEAVSKTTNEVGEDPDFGSRLLWYPPEKGNPIVTEKIK